MTHTVQASEIAQLIKQLKKANGADPDIDAVIHSVVLQPIATPSDDDIPHYTASEPACFELIRQVLPGWKWNVDHGVKDILPFASISNDEGKRFEAVASTAPMALLLAMMWALVSS